MGKQHQICKITDIFEKKDKTLSLEFFPPKEDSQLDSFFNVVEELISLEPDFLSVTYGAGGSTRDRTMEISTEIQDRYHIPIIHHITCVGHSRTQLIEILDLMKINKIMNILALRGDPPRGVKEWKPTANGFSYAYELCDLLRTSYDGHFSYGVAGFPEGHPESPNKDLDAKFLKNKIEHGAEFVLTQLFYENQFYYDYVSRLRNIGVTTRIIPGILPILNFKNAKNFSAFCGATITPRFHDLFEPINGDLAAMEKKGVELAIDQCIDLLKNGASGIHLYTLNKLNPIKEIIHGLKDFL